MTDFLQLSWNNHSSSFNKKLISMHAKNLYCDCTIVCDDKFYPAHKFVLSTCSEYFEEVFEKAVETYGYPFVILKDIAPVYLEYLFSFMYSGSVSISHANLSGLIIAAESLKIKGLAVPDGSEELEQKNISSTERKRQLSISDCDSSSKKVKSCKMENLFKLISPLSSLEESSILASNDSVKKVISKFVATKSSNKAVSNPISINSTKKKSTKLVVAESTDALNQNFTQAESLSKLCNQSTSTDSLINLNTSKSGQSELDASTWGSTSENRCDFEDIKVKVETSEAMSESGTSLKQNADISFFTSPTLQESENMQMRNCSQLSTWNKDLQRYQSFSWPFSDGRHHEIEIKEEPIGNYVSFSKTVDLSDLYLSEKLNNSLNVPMTANPKQRKVKIAKRRGRCRSSAGHSYKCSICNSSFASKSNVSFHVATVHEKVTSYPCPKCESVFSQKGNFKTHFSTVHLNIRPFECSICDAVFSQKGNLKSHYSSRHSLQMMESDSLFLKNNCNSNI